MTPLHPTGLELRPDGVFVPNLKPRCGLSRRVLLRAAVAGLPAALAASLGGCGQSPPPPPRATKTPADPLTPSEIELFLAMVQAHPRRRAPEFSNDGDNRPIDDALRPRNMVTAFHERFARLFDPQTQGVVLASQGDWAKLLTQYKLAPADFAALVTRISCAVTRLQLDGKFRFSELVEKATRRIDALVATIERYDAVPATQLTSEISRQRTQAIIQLGQTTALLEFARLLASVPPESLTTVATRLTDLTPLLPAQEESVSAFDELSRFDASDRISGQDSSLPR